MTRLAIFCAAILAIVILSRRKPETRLPNFPEDWTGW